MAPLRVSSPPSATSKTEPETIVAPLITLWLPLAVSTMPPLTVCHLPPEIVAPESSTTAPLPEARMLPLALLTDVRRARPAPARTPRSERGIDHRADDPRRAAAGRLRPRRPCPDQAAAHRQDGAVEGGKLGVGADRQTLVAVSVPPIAWMTDPDTIGRAADRIVALDREHQPVLRGLQLAAEDRPADEIDLFVRRRKPASGRCWCC